MARIKVLAPIILTLSLVCLTVAQEKIAPRIPNLPRIAKAWNSLNGSTLERNQALNKADALLHVRFGNQALDLNEERRAKLDEERRKACVGYYKQAREATIKQLEALNVLIEEEDY